MTAGQYRLRLGPVEYDGFTLPQVWREAYGVGQATIIAPDGRVVMRNAGSVYERREFIVRAARRNGRRWTS